MQVKCPSCRKPVTWSEAALWRPFCSKRCRLIDLGAWFNEEHRIADDTDPGVPSAQTDPSDRE
ncbi:MAG: DNA gyrase inhibitor YacG [Gammaproteobacteria bacterium]|nr:DNA gyrase inhibitor YacG [Gammaproteobacteria bacterium]NNF66266.1 DNA gyrase inhibitor YacG [Gammaproteobacteria bacterium]